MRVELVPAPAKDKETVRNLLQLYLHDLSAFDGRELDQHGRYSYRYLDDYWQEPNRHPFLIRVDDSVGGFALVSTVSIGDADRTNMSEFFIVRKYRGQAVGEAAARFVFARFPGEWIVSQLGGNVPAQQFWRKVIHRYTNGHYREEVNSAEHRIVQRFIV